MAMDSSSLTSSTSLRLGTTRSGRMWRMRVNNCKEGVGERESKADFEGKKQGRSANRDCEDLVGGNVVGVAVCVLQYDK